MSSTGGQKHKFMVYAPDVPNSPRFSVREQHLAVANDKLKDGSFGKKEVGIPFDVTDLT